MIIRESSMCNASNHSPSCRCGWGQGYNSHFSQYGESYPEPQLASAIRTGKRYESYLNPNATCTRCGANVFFYQCPNGGRVFFNDVGKPWEKHGCMISYDDKIKAAPKNLEPYNFDKSVFIPFQIIQIKPHKTDKTLTEITGSVNDAYRLKVYIKTELYRSSQIDYDTMCMIKRNYNKDVVLISYLNDSGNPTEIKFQRYDQPPAATKPSVKTQKNKKQKKHNKNNKLKKKETN